MSSQRIEKIQELIKVEISDIVRREVKHPGIGFITITSVEVSSDLHYAKVFVSIFGDEKEKDRSLAALQSAAGFIRGALGRRVRLRYIPELTFKLDTSIEYGDKIQRLLKQVNEERHEDAKE